MTNHNKSAFWQKAVLLCILSTSILTAQAALTNGGEYYLWLNIYEKLIGSNNDDTAPALSAFGINTNADNYIFVAEESATSGYVLLRQKSSGRYLAASGANSYSVVFESAAGTADRFLWKVDEGVYTYLTNKKNGKYVGVDGANKSKDYVSIYYDKPKGSHSQFSVIPATGNNWDEARQAYESSVYTNAQGIQEIDYCQLKDAVIDRSDAIDIHITANETPIIDNTTINLGSDRTWLVFDNIVPSKVISTYLKYVTINGQKASNGSNCRVAIYLNGAVVIPKPSPIMTCQGTNGEFTLNVGNKKDLSTQSNTMTSFVLRRGYMATLATGTEGSGYSRVYVADHADLEITLPKALTKRVSSVNVKQWQYLSKKGWGNQGGKSGTDQLRATWFWTWSADQASTADFEYVPCRQHRYWPSKDDVNSHTSTASVSLNEPEHSEQHDNCSCKGTTDEWTAYTFNNDFLPSGGRIGSPQPTDLGYLTNYFKHVDNMASRCDFAVTHAYWDLGDYDEASYANWFCNTQCKSVWNNTGRPLWLTEMEISASWNSNKVKDYEQNRKYLQVLLQKMEECPWIERYAIYGTDMWQTYMFYDANPSKGLTPAGQVYRDHRATFAYNAKYTKEPTWWTPGVKAPTLELKTNSTRNTITFTIGNTNGDATETLVLQRKTPSGWEDLYAVEDRSQLEKASFTYTMSLDDIDRENDIFRVATTTLYDTHAESSEESAGYIKNANITTSSKSEVPGWTCERTAYAGYTKDVGNTYLEVWNESAANIDFNYYQDIEDIPNGVYTLSAACFNSTTGVEGATINGAMGLYATADGVSYFAPVTTDSEIDYNTRTTIPTIVVRNHTMRIGIRNIARMTGRWAGADEFSLIYLGTERAVLTDITYQDIVNAADQSIAKQFPTIKENLRDATGLISNPDCARGDATFWTLKNLEIGEGESYDGNSSNKYFNIWKGSAYTSSLEQTINTLPAGEYTVTALLRGSSNQPLTLKAIHTPANGNAIIYSKVATGTGSTSISGSDYQKGWQKVALEPIIIQHGDQLAISAEFAPATGGWWSVDHFQLIYAPLPEQPDAITAPKEGNESLVSGQTTYYTLDGRPTSTITAPGLYLKHTNGTTQKVWIR